MPQSERSHGTFGKYFSCCGCVDGENVDIGGASDIPKPRGCTDIAWLVCYVVFCCIMVRFKRFFKRKRTIFYNSYFCFYRF
jgi:hypothetical protein